MRKLGFILLAILSISSCHQYDNLTEPSPFEMQGTSAEYLTVSELPVTTVSGSIWQNTTWSGVIEITGVVEVKEGATLTILPGTFIKGKRDSDYGPSGVLIISKRAKINAVGTEAQPIVFTSYRLLDGNEDTTASPGDFGGVIILGQAPTNLTSDPGIEGFIGSTPYKFGGYSSNDNSGILKYVRIEFAGYDLLGPNSGNEINGLTLGGVGNGTVLDHIQVSYSLDDSFEFFGGTVNASNLISLAPQDDSYDFDNGYTGTVSCALALADYNSLHSITQGYSPDSNGVELDNNYNAGSTTLITRPVLNNMTIIGPRNAYQGSWYENGIHVRRNGKLTLNNSVVTGYPVGILLETASAAPVNLADFSFTNVQVHGFTWATASKVGSATSAFTIPGVTFTATASPAANLGMTQPYYNEGMWDVSPRNCGDFRGIWTKYDFSIVE
ncbi:hypothetical protein [Chryseobacterium tongliaoense]|uniref:hypothetical protein n=1 Tax=Chryseobacterium tongliaoense TaxID=3240933 RepID=UPI00351184C1